MNEDSLDDSVPLGDLYEKVRCVMPTQKELEPLLEMDRDEKKVRYSFDHSTFPLTTILALL